MAAWILFLLLAGAARSADVPPPSEHQLKAAFLFNFAKFVEWPPERFPDVDSPLIIGVLGKNPFGDSLAQTIRSKSIDGRPVAHRAVSSAAEGRTCHVLFISSSEKDHVKEIIAVLRGSSVLTVGEMDQFIEAGGMIQLVIRENKVRFLISEETAKGAGLKVSSKLLGLALPRAT